MFFDHQAQSFHEAIGLEREQFEAAIRESEKICRSFDRWSLRLESVIGNLPEFPPELAVKLMALGWLFFSVHTPVFLAAIGKIENPFDSLGS